MFTLILGKEDDAVIDEGLVAIMDVYNGRPTPSFRYAEALQLASGSNCPALKQIECLGTLTTWFTCSYSIRVSTLLT